eukprot:2171663-Amphidinium_carterae.1
MGLDPEAIAFFSSFNSVALRSLASEVAVGKLDIGNKEMPPLTLKCRVPSQRTDSCGWFASQWIVKVGLQGDARRHTGLASET